MSRPSDPDRARSGVQPIRASDAERERAMDALRDAAAEGRLTFEELSDRIEAAAGAVHRTDLARLTDDLPVQGGPAGVGSTELVPAPPARQTTVFGDVRRTGVWRVPERSRWSTMFGDVVLDLREATVAHDRIEIDASSVFGDIVLLVPVGVHVDVRARVGMGEIRQRAGQDPAPGAPVIVLTGGTWFGDVRILERRLRDRLAAFLRVR